MRVVIEPADIQTAMAAAIKLSDESPIAHDAAYILKQVAAKILDGQLVVVPPSQTLVPDDGHGSG